MNDRGWVKKTTSTRGVETPGKIMTGWENNDRVLSEEKSLIELSCTKDLEQYGRSCQ